MSSCDPREPRDRFVPTDRDTVLRELQSLTAEVDEGCKVLQAQRVAIREIESAYRHKLRKLQKRYIVKADIAPTLLAHNPSQVINHLNRTLTPKEMLLLQGFRPTLQFPQMGYLQINLLMGNSMNVAVLKRIIERLLR